MADFEIKEMFRSAFGFEMPEEQAEPKKLPQGKSSNLSQPYYANGLYGRVFYLPVKLNDYVLPFATIDIACKKTIVSTSLPERSGTVKEMISTDDYVISVRGVAVSADDHLPEEELTKLQELFVPGTPVELHNIITDMFLKGRPTVVITDLKLPAVTNGVQHARPYEITLVSDVEYTLEIPEYV
ncbi:DUF6046 domain-containing protein [Chitinophaga solisilvae]|uniref:DUF6046 domain-containing protein n=1 Tax=Chitinophaga solisilvae TaxID=1233460 RepID=UPI0013688091|nr:DUF6046 domain-containing protein [Chitinophaga solisilvae]